MWYLYGLVIVAGALNSVQAGANAALGKGLGVPYLAALAVTAVSASTLLAVGLLSGRLGWPGSGALRDTPWWAWTGGAFAALFILSQLFAANRIGAGAFMGLSVTAAIASSVALDHFGLVGFEEHRAGLLRLLGTGLMIAGVTLVALF